MMKKLAVVAVLFAVAVTLAGCPAVTGAVNNIPPVKVGDEISVQGGGSGTVAEIRGTWVKLPATHVHSWDQWVNLANAGYVEIRVSTPE